MAAMPDHVSKGTTAGRQQTCARVLTDAFQLADLAAPARQPPPGFQSNSITDQRLALLTDAVSPTSSLGRR
jgi:hypothetical protein